jgi:hypothetical protein
VTESGIVCWIAPDVAITLTVDVVGLGEEDPPHPVRNMAPKTETVATSIHIWMERRLRHPRKHNAIASVAPGISLGYRELGFGLTALVLEEAETVSVVVATPPEGVTLAGENVQVAPVGSPEQLKVVAEAKPFCGINEIVTVPLCPGEIVSDD